MSPDCAISEGLFGGMIYLVGPIHAPTISSLPLVHSALRHELLAVTELYHVPIAT